MASISASRYFEVFENLDEAVLVTDGVELVWCVQKTADLLGYSSPNEIIGKEIMTELVASDYYETIEQIKKIFETGKNRDGHLRLRKKDGSILSCIGKSSSFNTSSGVFVVTFIRERDSAVTNDQLNHLLTSIKHEINTPVTVIWGYAEMIQNRHGDNLHPEVMRFLDKIIENAKRLEVLSKALIKLEAGQNE
jgi:signal transduction histidine kinase